LFELKFSKPATDFDAYFIQISDSLNSKKITGNPSLSNSISEKLAATRLSKEEEAPCN